MIKPIGHGAYGVVISALDHESNSKVRDQRISQQTSPRALGSSTIRFWTVLSGYSKCAGGRDAIVQHRTVAVNWLSMDMVSYRMPH